MLGLSFLGFDEPATDEGVAFEDVGAELSDGETVVARQQVIEVGGGLAKGQPGARRGDAGGGARDGAAGGWGFRGVGGRVVVQGEGGRHSAAGM
mgnify:CR=1 FL=1